MKVQRDETFSAAIRRQKGEEMESEIFSWELSLRSIPNDFNAACGSGKGKKWKK